MRTDVREVDTMFREKYCDSPDCGIMVPVGVPLCRSCVFIERRRNGGTGAGHPPRGRFEARVQMMMQLARMLDQAEADHKLRHDDQSHTALMVAFNDYRRAVRQLDK